MSLPQILRCPVSGEWTLWISAPRSWACGSLLHPHCLNSSYFHIIPSASMEAPPGGPSCPLCQHVRQGSPQGHSALLAFAFSALSSGFCETPGKSWVSGQTSPEPRGMHVIWVVAARSPQRSPGCDPEHSGYRKDASQGVGRKNRSGQGSRFYLKILGSELLFGVERENWALGLS